ncbi:MAG: hypothetical protein AAF456_16815 [Planctomycetota bacterium]
MHPSQHRDIEHLSMLAVFHYVHGALILLFALFPLIYIILGAAFISGAMDDPGRPNPPRELGYFFIFFGLIASAMFVAFGLVILRTGRLIARHSNYMWCMVVCILQILVFPLGTILGAFTLAVLGRPGVKFLFGHMPYGGATYGQYPPANHSAGGQQPVPPVKPGGGANPYAAPGPATYPQKKD